MTYSLTINDVARLAYTDRTGRKLPPSSHPTSGLLTGSGANVRRYSCACCGRQITTDCARYRPTVHAARSVREHVTACALEYVARHDAIELAGEVA